MILFLLNAWRLTRNVTRYILDLFLRYPLQISLVLICLYCFWQKTRYDAIVSEFGLYRANIAHLAELQKVKNALDRKRAQDEVAGLIAEHKQKLADAGLDRKRVEDKLKGSINEISNELNIYRSAISLRNSASGIDVSKVAENTSGTANAGTDCNATLATVVDACKVTDIDYETLYNLYARQCKIYGCE